MNCPPWVFGKLGSGKLGRTLSISSSVSTPIHSKSAFQMTSQEVVGMMRPRPTFKGLFLVRSSGYFPRTWPPLTSHQIQNSDHRKGHDHQAVRHSIFALIFDARKDASAPFIDLYSKKRQFNVDGRLCNTVLLSCRLSGNSHGQGEFHAIIQAFLIELPMGSEGNIG